MVGTSEIQQERFAPFLALLLVAMHLAALAGLVFVCTFDGFYAFVAAHLFFATFGVSLGYHRFFSHRSFEAHPVYEAVVAVVATLCFQGGPIYWATVHRMHHARSERKGDAHSAARGLLWAHCLWMTYIRPNGFSYSRVKHWTHDLQQKPFLVWLDRYQLNLNIAALGLLFIVCGLFHRWDLAFWLGPVRIVSVWHATWLINSWYHGARLRGGTNTHMRNDLLADIVLGGEGWHKAHHERPGLITHPSPFRLDTGYWALLALKRLRIVRWRYNPDSRGPHTPHEHQAATEEALDVETY